MPSPIENDLATALCKHIRSAEMVRFMKNGSDASAAVRLSRAFTGRNKIVSVGYHGWHGWYISSTSRSIGIPTDIQEHTVKVPFNQIEEIQKVFTKYENEIAAIIVEPYYSRADPGYLEALKKFVTSTRPFLFLTKLLLALGLAWVGPKSITEYFLIYRVLGKRWGMVCLFRVLLENRK